MILLMLIILGLCFGSMINALVWRLHWHEQMAEESKLKHITKTLTNSPSRPKPKVAHFQSVFRSSAYRSGTLPHEKTDWKSWALLQFWLKWGSLSGSKKLLTRGHSSGGHDSYSMLTGRSMCIHCKRELAAKDLVPIVSWLALKGKCRYCKKPISWQYPLVEIATALLFAVSYIFWPLPLDAWYQWLNLGIWCIYIVGLIVLFMYDLRWYLLPDKIVWPLVTLALANAAIQTLAQPQADIWGAVQFYAFGLLPVAGLYWLIYVFSHGRLVGLGDVKLGVFIGLALGWPMALLTLFLANLLGAVFAVPLMIAGKLKPSSRVPFGPFLIVAFLIAGLWGMDIINLYVVSLGLGES